jgi:hypothetical protein
MEVVKIPDGGFWYWRYCISVFYYRTVILHCFDRFKLDIFNDAFYIA